MALERIYYIIIGLFALFLVYRISRHWNDFKNLIRFIFFRKKIIEQSAKNALKERNKLDDRKEEESEKQDYGRRFAKLENSIIQGFITALLVVATATITADLLTKFYCPPDERLLIIQVFAAFVVLWALLSKLGFPIQTWKGNTIPEQLVDWNISF